MSHPSNEEGWVSLRRRPPKDAIVAFVVSDILCVCVCFRRYFDGVNRKESCVKERKDRGKKKMLCLLGDLVTFGLLIDPSIEECLPRTM